MNTLKTQKAADGVLVLVLEINGVVFTTGFTIIREIGLYCENNSIYQIILLLGENVVTLAIVKSNFEKYSTFFQFIYLESTNAIQINFIQINFILTLFRLY